MCSLFTMDNLTYTLLQNSELVFTEEIELLRKFIYHAMTSIVIFGLTSNTINILIFAKIGLKDNVTITLLFLSVSDLLYLIVSSPTFVAKLIQYNYPQYVWSSFHPSVLSFGLYWYAYLFYDYSSFISVFLAVVRCLCIAKPLLFKSMLTKSRTLTTLALLFLVTLALRFPVLLVIRFIWTLNPQTNSTFLSTTHASNFKEIYKANDIINRNTISWLAYLTVVACLVILVSKLQAASRFRRSLASVQNANDVTAPVEKMTDRKQGNLRPSTLPAASMNNKLSSKSNSWLGTMSARDLQVIQSVTMICAIFIISQVPFQVISTVRLLNPEFNEQGKEILVYGFASTISIAFTYLNASVNIFVHFNFNKRYREKFLSMFSLKK